MKPITLDDLPRWSSWPKRLLGIEPWTPLERTTEKIQQEYDQDKYAACLNYYLQAQRPITAEDVKQFEYGTPGTLCMSVDEQLYEASLEELHETYQQLLTNTLRELGTHKAIVELGAGYGYNIWSQQQRLAAPDVVFYGGDYSQNAVHLAAQLYADNDSIHLFQFNFYDPATYQVFETLPSPIAIFTSHAIEQLPSVETVLPLLATYRHKIGVVVHFEPIYELLDDSLLGLMRRRYTEVNDYNRDLLTVLRAQSEIRILTIQPHVVGLNPLNPTSVITWEFLS